MIQPTKGKVLFEGRDIHKDQLDTGRSCAILFGAVMLSGVSKIDFSRQLWAHSVAVLRAGGVAALLFLASALQASIYANAPRLHGAE